MKRVPSEFQSALWSYNISKIDANKNYHLVITQLLNYAGQDGEDWVVSNYPEEKIKEVISKPSRGVWFRKKLLLWKKRLNIKISNLDFEMAIFNLYAEKKLELIKKFYQREEKMNKDFRKQLVKMRLNSS